MLLPLASIAATPASADAANAGNVEVELVAEVDAVVPGEPFWIALRQRIRPGWHTYWRNPGDSGAPTTLEFSMPDGFSAGEIQWPVPERIPYGPLMNFGYHDEVWLPVRISVPDELEAETVTLAAHAEWLVCADICIPEEADLHLELPVAARANPSAAAPRFEEVRQRIPQTIGVDARQSSGDGSIMLAIDMEGLRADRIQDVTFFPFTEGLIENTEPQSFRLVSSGIEIRIRQGYDFTQGAPLDGIVVIEEHSGESLLSAFEIHPQPVARGVEGMTGRIDLPTALLFAFIGGLILNLMPCVFPVLSIKILSLMGQVGTRSGAIRLHGWVYLGGVVSSFIAVAVVLIALRAGGAEIGWGFQLQSPLVVGLLAYLFFVIGLNLFGFFELGTSIMNFGQGAANQEGLSGSFLTGVLATIVAAPCTVPFMAGAIGFALTQSNVVALATFAALGLGMATPYVALCHWPAAMDRLPGPGPWMARFRELLAFPMFASAVWLVWVLSQQAGSGGVLAIGAGLVMIAFAIWLLRHLPHRLWLRVAAQGVAVVLLAGAVYLPSAMQAPLPVPGETDAAASPAPGYSGPAWETWSPEREQALRAEGPVFVNFTAAWCITCKVNEAVALDSTRIKRAFEEKGVSYLKGDWTNEDPAITRALEEYERSGVPLYLLYRPGDERARVLPQVLTESIVLRAIEEL